MSENKVVDVILHCQKQLKKEKLPAEKLLHYLGRLSRLRITVPDLAETGIGRTVNSLSRNEGSVGQAAETLVRGWKQMVSEQQSQAEAQRKSEEESNKSSDSNSGSSDEDEDELNNDASEPYDIDEQVENPVEPFQNGHVNEVGPPSNRNEEFADEDEDVDDDIEDPYMSDGFLNMTNVHTDEEDEDESEQDSDSDASDNLRIADEEQQQMQRETEDLKINTYIKQAKHRESDDFNKANTFTKHGKQREPEDVKVNAYIKQEKQREPENPKVNSNSYIKPEKQFEPEDLNDSDDPFMKQEKPREPEYLKGKTFIKQEIPSETEDVKINTYIKQNVEAQQLNSAASEKGREHKAFYAKAKGSHQQSGSNIKSHHHRNDKSSSRSRSPGSKESTKEHKHHKQSKEHRSSKHGDQNSESKSRHHHSSKERPQEKERSSSKDKQRSKESSSHRDSKSDKERERSKEKKDSTNQNRTNNTTSTHHHSKDKDKSREMSSLKSSSSPDRKKSELHEERKRKDPSDDGASTLNKKPKLVIKEEIDSTSGVNFSDVLGCLDGPSSSSSKLKKIKKEVDDPVRIMKSYDKHESRKKKHESSSSSASSSKHLREQEGSSSSRKSEKDSERIKLSKKPIHVKIEPAEKPAVHISPNYKPVHPPLPSIPRPSTSNGNSATLPLSHAEISDLGHGDYWDNNEKDFTGMSQEDAISTMLSNRNARSKVFSGVKSARRGDVPTLFDLSMQVIKDNIGELGYTGGIPYDILKPALERANPQQLTNIESQNDHLIGETDELWQFHCRRDFRGHCPVETESWRELYERCKEGQQQKFEQIRKKMKLDMMKRETAEPVRKTKLAYVDITSGPRFHKEKAQTIKNGMKTLKIKEEKGVSRGGATSSASVGFNNPKISGDPTKVIVQEASVIIAPGSRSGHAPAPSVSRDREYVAKQKPKKAPLMQKTMKLIRSLNRR